jgi:serine phosphatase RsbU (regulator of sigma subunit)
MMRSDGWVQVLDTPPDRLLGTEFPRPRTDHQVVLHAGDTLILYTDGLLEHGRTGIDEGIARLIDALPALADLPLEKLCDQLLDHIVADRADDDIAVLALRCHAGTAEPAG